MSVQTLDEAMEERKMMEEAEKRGPHKSGPQLLRGEETERSERTQAEGLGEGYGASVDERTLDIVAAEIRALTANALNTIVEIGRRMTEAKAMLPHGEFGRWIREEAGYSTSTANNFMRLFEAYADPQGSLFGAEVNCQTFGNLTYSKALALLEVPAEEREEFARENDVEGMSTRELQAAIRERDEARWQAEAAEADKRAAEDSRAKMEEDMAHANERMEGLARELEELKAQPKDVAVEKVTDQEAIDAAVKEALEKQGKELDAAKKKLETAEKKAEKAERATEQAKAEAEAAGKGNSDALEAARQEAEQARQEAEKLKKELRMADTAVAAFRVYFTQWQNIYGCMERALEDVEKETADKLRAAVRAQMEAWGR